MRFQPDGAPSQDFQENNDAAIEQIKAFQSAQESGDGKAMVDAILAANSQEGWTVNMGEVLNQKGADALIANLIESTGSGDTESATRVVEAMAALMPGKAGNFGPETVSAINAAKDAMGDDPAADRFNAAYSTLGMSQIESS